MAVTRPDDVGTSTSTRRLLVGGNVVLTIILAVALVGVLQWGAFTYGGRADWTSSSVNSLSEGTENLLNSLDTDVRLTSLYFSTDLEERDQARYRKAADDLINLYAIANRVRVRTDYVNPLKDHAGREALLERLRGIKKFKEESVKHEEFIDRFNNQMVGRINELVQGELSRIEALSDALAAAPVPAVAEMRKVLLSWQQELTIAQRQVQDATSADVPMFEAATSAIRSCYSVLRPTMERIGPYGRQQAQTPGIPEGAAAFLRTAGDRYQELADALQEEINQANQLPTLELTTIISQLGPTSNALLVETDEDAKVVSFSEAWPARNPGVGMPNSFEARQFRGEEKITSALLQLTQKEKTAVVFVRFGGSPLFFGGFAPGQPPAPYGQLRDRLQEVNFDVREWDLATQDAPPEFDPAPPRTIYVVLKPTAPPRSMPGQPPQQPPISETQKRRLFDAMGDDPRAVFLAGWSQGPFGLYGAPYEYADYLKENWGMDVDSATLLLYASSVAPGKYRLVRGAWQMNDYRTSDHVVVSGLGAMRAMFPMCAPVNILPESPEGVTVEKLVWCERRDGLWGARNVQAYQEQVTKEFQTKVEGDLEGPFTLAALAEKDADAGAGKVVVISARDFVADSTAFAPEMALTAQGLVLRNRNPGNLTLFINSLHWLNDNTQWMNVGRPIDVAVLNIEEGPTLSFIRLFVHGVWPALALACGLGMWLVRRS